MPSLYPKRLSLLRLQWGHRFSSVEIDPLEHRPDRRLSCFNGATDFHRWKYHIRLKFWFHKEWLQWGHRFSSVEMAAPHGQIGIVRRASMGPPIFIGGNDSTVSDANRGGACFNGATDFHRWKLARRTISSNASMTLQWGHRFSSVEIIETVNDINCFLTLQWGHRFSSVEMLYPAARMSVCSLLQWGHRFSSVEICLTMCRIRRRSHGFNGATDFHRWKSLRVLARCQASAGASMGPPIFIGGNLLAHVVVAVEQAASMGPPIFIGGNYFPTATAYATRDTRFNGATDFHRWKS